MKTCPRRKRYKRWEPNPKSQCYISILSRRAGGGNIDPRHGILILYSHLSRGYGETNQEEQSNAERKNSRCSLHRFMHTSGTSAFLNSKAIFIHSCPPIHEWPELKITDHFIISSDKRKKHTTFRYPRRITWICYRKKSYLLKYFGDMFTDRLFSNNELFFIGLIVEPQMTILIAKLSIRRSYFYW